MSPRSWQVALLSSTLAITLAACSNQEPAQTESSGTDATQQDAAATPAQPAPLLEIPFEHVVLEQTGVFADDGDTTVDSTLTAEFLTGTPEELAESLTSSLRAQGFRLSNSEPARGGERYTYRRAEGERLSVLIRPVGEVRVVTDGAQGSIFISWRH